MSERLTAFDTHEYSLVSMSMSCLGSLSEVSSCWFVVLCVAHDVCIVLWSSSMFLVSFFCYVIMEERLL